MNKKNQESLLLTIKNAAKSSLISYQEYLLPKLSKIQKETLKYTQKQEFNDGAWYRPIHNLIVPIAMENLIKLEKNVNSDLMLAAILHDIGYSQIHIANTLEGANWEGIDKREVHMKIGSFMANKFLTEETNINKERIDRLTSIIAEHDNPYIGKTLNEKESIFVRDADRCFVPSTFSFYKDYLAYLNDEKFNNKILCIKDFLHLRISNFYKTYDVIPKKIQELIDEKTIKTLLVKRENFEAMNTNTGLKLISEMLYSRAQEVQNTKVEDVFENESFFIDSALRDLAFF
jgi:hypothetical protein